MGRNERQNQGNVRDEDPRHSCRRQIIQNDQPSLCAAAGSANMLDIPRLVVGSFVYQMAYPPTQNGNLLLCLQEGDLTAQEKLLAGIPIRDKNKTISEKISRNIFKLIWAQ
ncbi:hypothetical protein CY35_06G007700 [Sphagnum magellanicum]|nr:hypothetical protein CY35_06G007700 [Sphagnum magellanicum]